MEDDQPANVGATPSSNEDDAENTENRRLDSWVLLCTLSSITLAAYLSTDIRMILAPGSKFDKIVSDQATILCISISIALSTVGTITTIITTLFLIDALWAKILELILSIISIAAWIIVLIATLGPRYGLSQVYVGEQSDESIDYQPITSNANLYFMSWGSGICAFLIFVDVVIHIYESKIIKPSQSSSSQHRSSQYEVTNYAVKKLCLVMIASAILVTEGLNYENELCANDYATDISCRKTQYAFYTGIVGLSIAFVAVFEIILITLFSCLKRESSSQTSSPAEGSSIVLGLNLTVISFLMSINFSIAVGMLTFNQGPATKPCNAYFAAWLGFFLSYSVLWALMKKVLSFITVKVKERKTVAGGANEPTANPGVSGEIEEEEKVEEVERDEEDYA